MTVMEAAVDMLQHTWDRGKWKDGDRFWVQVRAYREHEVVLRFFNMETGETYDRVYPLTVARPE
ncbi:MAG: hypothetical protein HY660_10485 [Armatimonadetes bacterium]|nr:hypothetical protein [Armatimonadota bacterium]